MRPTVERAYQGKALVVAQRARADRWQSTWVSGIAAAVAFFALTWAIGKGSTQAFDVRASWAVHAYGGAWTGALMVMLTTLADPLLAVAFSMAVAWLALRRGDTRGCAVAAGWVWIAAGLNFVLKHLFHRARPTLWADPGASAGFSFPSWHAMAVVAVGGTLVLVLSRLYPRARLALGVGVAVLGVGIALSRVYLGLHWVTDVLAGGCAGWILLLGAASLLEAKPFPVEAAVEDPSR